MSFVIVGYDAGILNLGGFSGIQIPGESMPEDEPLRYLDYYRNWMNFESK